MRSDKAIFGMGVLVGFVAALQRQRQRGRERLRQQHRIIVMALEELADASGFNPWRKRRFVDTALLQLLELRRQETDATEPGSI